MKKPLFYWRFLAFLLVLSLIFAILFAVSELTRQKGELDVVNKDATSLPKTIILDAGHGGEDGGASSADGLIEKDLNLALALTMRDILQASGIKRRNYKWQQKNLNLKEKKLFWNVLNVNQLIS